MIDIPLESHVLYQHFYFNSLFSTKISAYPFMHKGTESWKCAIVNFETLEQEMAN